MLYSLAIIVAVSLSVWSLLSKNRNQDYLHAVGMTLIFSVLLANTVSIMSASIIISICFLILYLLISTSLSSNEPRTRKVYKAYPGKIIIFLIMLSALILTYQKIIISNLTYTQIEVNEDLIVLVTLFFISLGLTKNKGRA